MSLIFTRIARNFAKNGYFPTDDQTLTAILSKLSTRENAKVRIIDPCCGEGVALSECQNHLQSISSNIESIGIEIDKERANYSNDHMPIDRVVHGNLNDCYIKSRQFGLLFLNPPYGDMVSDVNDAKRERYETMFYENTNKLLQFGGVIVLIIPYYSYAFNDAKLAKIISMHFQSIKIYKAPEQQFKQTVLFGVRKKASSIPDKKIVELLLSASKDIDCLETLTINTGQQYVVPSSSGDIVLKYHKLEATQLEQQVSRQTTLWDEFSSHFMIVNSKVYQPLNMPSKWHTALALASGRVSGMVVSKFGQKLLVKGNTYKKKKVSQETQHDGENTTVITTSKDIFCPTIKAIDMTKGLNFGNIITIE